MKFLADMCISSSTVNFLRDHDYDVLHVRDRGLHKATDTEILDIAIKENRAVLTFDLDFTDLMAASGKKLPSVILLRLSNAKPENVNGRLLFVLDSSKEFLEKGAIVSIDDNKYRIRMLPIN